MDNQLLSLGAINKITGRYASPRIANKKDQYICPDCNKDLILCQGKIRTPHFRHKIDANKPCHYYSSNPGESQNFDKIS
jgi:competence CoiA-like predicted nuclease